MLENDRVSHPGSKYFYNTSLSRIDIVVHADFFNFIFLIILF